MSTLLFVLNRSPVVVAAIRVRVSNSINAMLNNFFLAIFDVSHPRRCWIKMSRKRVRCNSNFGPNSTRKMWRKNWFKTSPCGCFTCRSKMLSWPTTFIAHPRRPFYSLRTPFKPNMAITIRNCTLPVTWPTTASFRNGTAPKPRHPFKCHPIYFFYFLFIYFL